MRLLAALGSAILSRQRCVSRVTTVRFFSAELQRHHDGEEEGDDGIDPFGTDSDFDSKSLEVPGTSVAGDQQQSLWDEKHRRRTDEVVFNIKESTKKKQDDKKMLLARALLEAALDGPDSDEDSDADFSVTEENQRSLNVGIIGAPNAGKSALTNFMVGTKVSAVSRKTNTTTQEVLGVMTNGNTQICFFDTPGLMLSKSGYPYKDVKARVQSAWNSIKFFDVLMVVVDIDRHITRSDSRVVNLIKRVGAQEVTNQKRILCMNKIDLVKNKKDLASASEKMKEIEGYDRHFMISGLKGVGVKDLSQYLLEQAVKRPWDEDPLTMSEEVMKSLSLEVVRERLLDHVHQEIPYEIDHRMVDWKELRDGSLRIEQHFITHKESRRMILVGKNGSKIGRIGVEANEELRSIFKREVHLILRVRVK